MVELEMDATQDSLATRCHVAFPPLLPEAESKRLTDQLMADSNTYVRRSVERAIERRKREIRAAGKARKSADQVSAQLQAIEDEFGKTAATKSLRMAERYSEMLVASIVHDLRSIMTHLKVNCYSLIEEVIADAGSQAKRYGVRVRNDLQLLESSVEDNGNDFVATRKSVGFHDESTCC